MYRIPHVLTAVLVGLASFFPAVAPAQDWPSRPVRIVAPFAPGGSADTLGRTVAEQLSESLRQQFFVENRGGAGGLVGSAAVAATAPDGYNFVISGIASHVIAPATNPNAGFDPIRDFSHIAYLGGPPIAFVVHPSLGVKSLKELLDLAKTNKDGMGYVSPGPGTLGNLVAEYWARKENVKLDHIPYKGASQAVTDLIAGHVKVGSMTFTTASAHIRSKAVVPIAVSSANRLAEFPDVPTFKELGYPDLVATTWFSFSGPAKLPNDLVQKLNQSIISALDTPQVRKRLEFDAMETEKKSPEEFTRFVEAEIAKWGPIAKDAMASAAPAR
jgi:tripartite-type tricarboxylate transporter receptor subunit TctC